MPGLPPQGLVCFLEKSGRVIWLNLRLGQGRELRDGHAVAVADARGAPGPGAVLGAERALQRQQVLGRDVL